MTGSKVAALLEKITRIIPGIAGYQDRERRRESDGAVRAKAADEVARCRQILSDIMEDMSRSGGKGNLKVVGGLEQLATKLERTEDELRFAPYGYAGWFDAPSVTIDELERLYEVDLALLSAATALPEYIGDGRHIGTDSDWTPGFDRAHRNLRDALDGRKRLMEDLEPL